MIALHKFVKGKWENVREYLEQDLRHIEAAINAFIDATYDQEDGRFFEDAMPLMEDLEPGVYGDETHVPQITVSETGHIEQIEEVEIDFSAAVAGSDEDVQYNDNGVFGGRAITAFGYWNVTTVGDPTAPELLTDSNGAAVPVWTSLV